jgi:hypothetical protein
MKTLLPGIPVSPKSRRTAVHLNPGIIIGYGLSCLLPSGPKLLTLIILPLLNRTTSHNSSAKKNTGSEEKLK